MSVAKRKSEVVGFELFVMRDGRKKDDSVHDDIIAEGDEATATLIGVKYARAAGLTDAEIEAMYGVRTVKFNPNHDELGRFTTGGGAGSDSSGTKEGNVSKEFVADVARKVAKDMGFRGEDLAISTESKTFMLNGKQHFYAGSANLHTGQGVLYLPHLSEDTVAGVAAHEVQHLKFQAVLQAYYKEYTAVMADPGPPPDPNGQYYWQKRGGKDAVMTPDGGLRPPYDAKYPIYTEFHEAYNKPSMQEFAEGDGVSAYSMEYWKGWKEGTTRTDIAVHETLAEMARLKYETGKLPEHWGQRIISYRQYEEFKKPEPVIINKPSKAKIAAGEKLWRNLFNTVSRIYKQMGKKKP